MRSFKMQPSCNSHTTPLSGSIPAQLEDNTNLKYDEYYTTSSFQNMGQVQNTVLHYIIIAIFLPVPSPNGAEMVMWGTAMQLYTHTHQENLHTWNTCTCVHPEHLNGGTWNQKTGVPSRMSRKPVRTEHLHSASHAQNTCVPHACPEPPRQCVRTTWKTVRLQAHVQEKAVQPPRRGLE